MKGLLPEARRRSPWRRLYRATVTGTIESTKAQTHEQAVRRVSMAGLEPQAAVKSDGPHFREVPKGDMAV